MGDTLKKLCRSRDVLLRPLGNVLYAVPSLCVTHDECQRIGHTLTAVVNEALQEVGAFEGQERAR